MLWEVRIVITFMGRGRSARRETEEDFLGNVYTSLYEYYTSIKIYKDIIAVFKNKINIFKNSKLNRNTKR